MHHVKDQEEEAVVSVAPTGPDHHVAVLLEDDIGAVVKVEHGDTVQLGGSAAGFGHCVWVYKVDLQQDGRGGGVRKKERQKESVLFKPNTNLASIKSMS